MSPVWHVQVIPPSKCRRKTDISLRTDRVGAVPLVCPAAVTSPPSPRRSRRRAPQRSGYVVSESTEALLLVRLRASRPDGTRVGERERTCHLVPFSPSEAVPEVLTAYCGLPITPGVAESLDRLLGMPCEACLARSPIPAFAMLRQLWDLDESLPPAPVGQLADRGVGE